MINFKWNYIFFGPLLTTLPTQAQQAQQNPLLQPLQPFKPQPLNSRRHSSIPGNSPFKHCSNKTTKDVLDINWVTLIPSKPHIGHTIQLMINGTLSKNISDNATIHIDMAIKDSKYEGLGFKYKFCEPLEEVMQEDGPRCPPTKGGVEITALAFVWFLSEGNVIETTLEAMTEKNETIACLYGELEVVKGGAGWG